MKFLSQILLLTLLLFSLNGQAQVVFEEGRVSFLSSKNVYVKFTSTDHIQPGDTLFFQEGSNQIPVLIVTNKSSSSTVCVPTGLRDMKRDEVVLSVKRVKKKAEEPVEETVTDPDPVATLPDTREETIPEEEVLFKEKIKGRISVATYNNIAQNRNTNRMRYGFSLRAQNIRNSRFSVEAFTTFRHNLGEWDKVRGNIGRALKVFALNVKYDINKTSSVTVGRKINPNFSSVGAIDGIQYEQGIRDFRVGAIVGFRPDFADFSPNFNLLQFGGYAAYVSPNRKRPTRTTIGFIEQRNRSNTDRRFVYLQHSAQWVKGLHMFGSMEVDLYENINNQVSTSPSLTNLFVSLRYRFSRKLRVSLSYDTRKNIVFYESYKSFIDQFIDNETRQGLRAGFTYKPIKNVVVGGNGAMRFQQSQRNPSRNVTGFVTVSEVPYIKARATVRANFLQTDFINSMIFGGRLSRDIIPGKLRGEIYYRWVDYQYQASETSVQQHIGGANLSVNIMKQLSLNLFYEAVIDDPTTTYHRVNARLIKRF